MRIFFVSFLVLLFAFTAQGQTTPLSFTTIGTGSDDFLRPGGGANEWSYDQYINQIPTNGVNSISPDRYWRFTWLDFQAAGSASNAYNFSVFDSKIQQSITKGQSFSFGVMQQCGGCDGNLQTNVGGSVMLYPNYLHAQMQAESPTDYATGGEWFPNYNSPSYLTALKNLNIAINNHIMTGSFNGINYRDIIGQIDIRGYGDFGEWTNNTFNAGTLSAASGDSIISYHVHVFDQFQCVIMIAAFDGNQLSNTMVTPAIGYYALTARNSHSRIGWRRDNWGQTDGYISSWTDGNNTTFNGLRFKDSIMTRYLTDPVTGEPQDGGSAGNFPSLDAQVKLDGAQSFGNGNFNNGTNATIAANFRTASKDAGYRIVVLSAGSNMTTTPQPGGTCNISLNWQNVNGIPAHQDFRVVYEWRTAGGSTVLQRDTAVFNLYNFANKTGALNNENFTMRTVPAGTADLYMKVIQPRGYKKTMPLFITGVKPDGAYLLRASIPIAASGPVANAGTNITTTGTSVNLTAASSTGATTYAWTQLSGPNTATLGTPGAVTTTASGLITGTYVFQVCINGGPCSGQLISSVTVSVNIPVIHANAGNNQTISLPTSSTGLSASGSTGTITSYAWVQVSGPNTANITSPSTVTTNVTGLIQGTYVFRVSVNGGVSTADVSVLVLAAAAPVANAGTNQTITLPTASVTLNGNGSTGTITSYTWSQFSGPSAANIVTPATVSTIVSGLIQGVYVFKLLLNGGSFDTLQVTVNPAAPPSPSTNTIFTTQTPNGAVQNDGQALEIGVKFRSSSAGYITGIRFYKSAGNNGTHTGQIYTSTGTLLGSFIFTTESLTGWQTVAVVPAIPINANTTYVAAYFSPNGTYTSTTNYFTTAVVNSPLTALADGTDGVNGVFKYTTFPAFPTTGFQKSNYWVDVVFSLNNPGASPIHKNRSIYYQHLPRP